ncbi:hypothetical protein OAT15_03190 [Gammaproteobacteria bacterium]|jgi:hypothetical protein|nr:hypothetical protein [Gammaproteobacteria bacterium]
MEINFKELTSRLFISLFLIFLTLSISAQANIKQAVIKDGSKITFLYSTVYLYKDNLLSEIDISQNIDLSGSDSNVRTLRLEPDQYIKVKGLDGREKLFNGSIIVKFKSSEDLEAFSLRNEVMLLNNLPDIGRGVFKIDDIYNFNEKLDQLKSNNPNIERVELNTIDISIRPK